ncbi:MAG TPA: CHAD domain-containing protein [Abditibacteriaceae bacterium]|jgi:CHAD domain-containing protein
MADIAQDAALQADDSVLSAAGKLFCYLWGEVWHHAPGTAEGDADELHDMRVGVRRLRSALQNFEGSKTAPLLGSRLRREFAEQRGVLNKLGDVLGAVRDHDVLDDYLKEYAKTRLKKDVRESPGLLHFERFLQTERAQAFAPLVKRINRSQEPGRLREEFARYALGVPAVTLPPGAPLLLIDAARCILPQRVQEVLSHAPALDDPNDAEGHHELRKSLKRLRYSLEFFAPCFSEKIKPHLKNLTKLQDSLGEMNDRHVLRLKATEAFEKSGFEYATTHCSAKNPVAGTEDSAAEVASNSLFPEDIEAFLRYGDGRSRRLLRQVRDQWNELQTQGWPSSLLNLLQPSDGAAPDTPAEEQAEPTGELQSPLKADFEVLKP